jgi:hypothetical protein
MQIHDLESELRDLTVVHNLSLGSAATVHHVSTPEVIINMPVTFRAVRASSPNSAAVPALMRML